MKLIIFDFDGVLVDTLLACYSIVSETNEDLSIEEYKNFFAGNINDALRGNKKMNPHPDFFGCYDVNTREIKVPLILKALVEKLSENYILSIVSSTATSSIRTILEREGINKYFKDILGNDVHGSKVVKIEMVLEKENTLPKDTVFVTDTLGDILEGKKCDVKSIAVTWGFHDKETLEKGNPAVIVDNPSDLEGAIKDVLK